MSGRVVACPGNLNIDLMIGIDLSGHLLYICRDMSGQNSKKLTRSGKKDLNNYRIGLRIKPDQCFRDSPPSVTD
jgi:hypothetical protein